MSYKVEPHPKSGIFRMLGTVDGKRVRKSLKTRDLKSAELLAAKEAARLIRESYFGKEAEATISDAYIKWAEDRSLREGQRDHMSANMQPILRLVGEAKLKDFTPIMAQNAARKLYPNAKPQSWNTMVLCPLSAIINAAHQHGLCTPIRIKRFKVRDERIARPIDRKWLNQFMKHAEPHLAALAFFQFTTAARPDECCKLRPDQIDWKQCIAWSDATKNGKRRAFYLTPEMVSRLRDLPPVQIRQGRHAGENRVFKYAHPQSLRRPWARACKAAGLDYRDRYESGRHSSFTEMVTRQRVDPVTAGKIGNCTPAVLMRRYAHAEKAQQTAMEVFGKKLAQRNHKKLKTA